MDFEICSRSPLTIPCATLSFVESQFYLVFMIGNSRNFKLSPKILEEITKILVVKATAGRTKKVSFKFH